MVRVTFKNIVKKFKTDVALDDFSLEVNNGEFFTLLGPSGCGKTTALRVLAGFYTPDEGEVYFDDKLVTDLPPEKRNTAMVFQNYALFPHMSIFDNISYGLKVRKLSKTEIKDRLDWALAMVGMGSLEDRFPSALSGGQQQRVALARAIVVQPDLLLLDEPLSNLDAKLRASTRNEIARLQKKLGITTIYVTHDQEEAFLISDRIGVMFKGKVAQVGKPREVYEKPRDIMVAEFVGTVNLIPCKRIGAKNGIVSLRTKTGIDLEMAYIDEEIPSEPILMIRPERIKIVDQLEGPNIIKGELLRRLYTGEKILYEFACQDIIGEILRVTTMEIREKLSEGDTAGLLLAAENLWFIK